MYANRVYRVVATRQITSTRTAELRRQQSRVLQVYALQLVKLVSTSAATCRDVVDGLFVARLHDSLIFGRQTEAESSARTARESLAARRATKTRALEDLKMTIRQEMSAELDR